MQEFEAFVEKLFGETPHLSEIFFNGTDKVFGILNTGKYITLEESPFKNKHEMTKKLQHFSFAKGLRLDPLCPSSGGDMTIHQKSISHTYRWHILLPPAARDGPLVAVRKMNMTRLSIGDFAPGNSSRLEKVMKQIFNYQSPILLSGPTGSGKTTLLTRLLLDYCNDERLLILEQSPEIPRLSKQWVRLSAQKANSEGSGELSVSRLVEESLRLRADRVIVGEILGREAEGLFRVLQTSDRGPIATLHAKHPDFLIDRLSDLSGISKTLWLALFETLGPYCMQLKRQNPRLAGVYKFEQGLFKPIYSYDQT